MSPVHRPTSPTSAPSTAVRTDSSSTYTLSHARPVRKRRKTVFLNIAGDPLNGDKSRDTISLEECDYIHNTLLARNGLDYASDDDLDGDWDSVANLSTPKPLPAPAEPSIARFAVRKRKIKSVNSFMKSLRMPKT